MGADRVKVTAEIQEKLKAERERTGLGGRALMRGQRDSTPEDLRAQMIDSWVSGRVATAKKEHLDWVLKAYADWSPPEKAMQPERINLTDAQVAHLQKEVERTGLGAVNILRHARTALPDGLNHQKVQRWISGQTRMAMKKHWDFVLALYASISAKN